MHLLPLYLFLIFCKRWPVCPLNLVIYFCHTRGNNMISFTRINTQKMIEEKESKKEPKREGGRPRRK